MKDKLSVLMLCPQFWPIVGGYERAAERLSCELIKQGHNVTVVAERRDISMRKNDSYKGIVVRRTFAVYKRYFHTFSTALSLFFFLLFYGRKFDIWHVHQYGIWSLISIIFGKIFHIPVVLKLTNSGRLSIESQIRNPILKYIHRKVDACIAISEETVVDARTFGIAENNIQLIPNGFNMEIVDAACAENNKQYYKKKVKINSSLLAINVSNIREQKNHRLLLDAWSLLPQSLKTKCKLAILGDGPLYGEIRALVKTKELGDDVFMPGFIEDPSVWYSAADLYVISSDHEGLSNSMIEALASGHPVISTAVSGSGILSRENSGIVVEIGDERQLSDAIQELILDRQKLHIMSTNARNTFENNFSIDLVARKTLRLYNDLIKNNQYE